MAKRVLNCQEDVRLKLSLQSRPQAALVNCISTLFATLGNKLCLLQTDHSECANVCLEFW